MKIKIVATTDVGKERDNNEDAYILCPNLSMQDWTEKGMDDYRPLDSRGALLVVADGMGGANAGEVASAIALDAVRKTSTVVNIDAYLQSKDFGGLLEQCIAKADDCINQQIYEVPETVGMGTTIVACWLTGHNACVAWCGDSRAYVYRPSSGLRQLTHDHSLVQELIDKGQITEEEAFTHPDSSIITRGLGGFDSQAEPEVVFCELRYGDIILLCSDGLCGYCTDRTIEEVLDANYTDVINCRDELLRLALDAGGYDNICIALASVIADSQNVPVKLSPIKKVIRFMRRLCSVN